MIARILDWFHRRADTARKTREADAFDRGWNYAAGLLLKGSLTPDEILSQCSSITSGHPFDRGMSRAVIKWESIKWVAPPPY